MANGFRSKPAPTRKEAARQVNAELTNLQQAMQISQMMIRQLLESNRNMSEDLGRALNLISELQYKVLAVQDVAALDLNALNAKADALRLRDFDDASAREDENKNFTVGDVVKEDSTVILTSTALGDKGIFRSRLVLAECGVPDLISGLQGQPVGTKVDVMLNGLLHTVELLGIRQPPKQEAQPAEGAISQ